MKRTARLRQLLREPGIIVMPMVYDCLSAKLVQRAGFAVVGTTGQGIAASFLGVSDFDLITQTEMAWVTRNIASAVAIPLVADADTGYGGPLNMMRTVQEFEKAGAAGIYFEDQIAPKRAGYFKGLQVVSRGEMVAKIKAAVEAREDPDLVLIARTDAVATHGVDEAIERANLYHDAGADVAFVVIATPVPEEEIRRIAREVRAPSILNQAEGGVVPLYTAQQVEEMGFKIYSFSNTLMRTGGKAMENVLAEIQQAGTSRAFVDRMLTFQERDDILGLSSIYELEAKFRVEE